ncbi:hypothetical protein G6F64_014519 [Rhizopus arrhizus]|uniref:Uncharacterized protein n=1 Tax=Rhizopus oryzae TaxID=64495 RepID=A0A9P6WTR6_RHIOR|nr:hypothetical protein G6F64_014519 [Rhizopus arrhizus]
MITLADASTPPLRLPLGTDALRVIAEKNAYVAEETEAWKALAQSTDFPVRGLTTPSSWAAALPAGPPPCN